jgi:glucokinase
MARYLAFDVGATRTRAAVTDADGTVLGRHDRRTPSVGDGAAIADAVREAGLAAGRDADVAPGDLDRAAVATVAEIDRDRGGVVDPANFPASVAFVPFADALGDIANEVLLLNDATAGAIGERAAAASPPEDLVYLSVSTGIGAGVVADGRVLEGHHGNAAEVGHLTLDPASTLRCGCGGDGHWEAFCSGEGIPRYARHLAAERDFETDLSLTDLDAADVFTAAGDDPLADAVLERLAAWNTQGVAAIVHAYDPEVIAVGGAVALANPEHVVAPVRDRLPAALHVTPAPEVRLTNVGEDVVLRGAIERSVAGDQHDGIVD